MSAQVNHKDGDPFFMKGFGKFSEMPGESLGPAVIPAMNKDDYLFVIFRWNIPGSNGRIPRAGREGDIFIFQTDGSWIGCRVEDPHWKRQLGGSHHPHREDRINDKPISPRKPKG